MHMMVTSAISSFVSKLKDEEGQDLIEYAMLGGLVAAALIAAFILFNPAVVKMVNGIAKCVDFDASSVCVAGP
jgi:Flp pilus assembly pilin Flp